MARVLLVDDSPVALRVLATRLRADGIQVLELASLQAVRALDGPTLVALACAVIDLQLADGDGTDLAARLAVRRPTLAVAFFTTGATPSLVESARARGPVFFKPDVAPVVAWVRRILQPSQPPPTK